MPERPMSAWELLKIVATIGVLGGLFVLLSGGKSFAAILLIVAALLGGLAILIQQLKYFWRRSIYLHDPGARVNGKGLTLYAGRQETISWREMSYISTVPWRNEPTLLYGRQEDRGYKGHGSRMREVNVDFLSIEPAALVAMLQSHPCYQGTSASES